MGDLEQRRHKSSPAPVNFQFEDSRLGTKEYWDQFYDVELANFEDTGDEGEIWFGRGTESRLLKFILERVPLSARICDLGSGNGALLRRLRARGYSSLCGLDYSPKAVELAQRASSPSSPCCHSADGNGTRGADAAHSTVVKGTAAVAAACKSTLPPIHFQVVDLTAESIDADLRHRFDIILDKGTLDAISLAPDRERLFQRYQRNVCQLFRSTDQIDDDFELLGIKDSAAVVMRRKQKRLLIIVSCNFTKDELVDFLEMDDGLHFCAELPALPGGASSIQFGGKMGTTTTGAVFRWRGEDDGNGEMRGE